MKTYRVTVSIDLNATNQKQAEELAKAALEHLFETFNDDDSLKAARVVDSEILSRN